MSPPKWGSKLSLVGPMNFICPATDGFVVQRGRHGAQLNSNEMKIILNIFRYNDKNENNETKMQCADTWAGRCWSIKATCVFNTFVLKLTKTYDPPYPVKWTKETNKRKTKYKTRIHKHKKQKRTKTKTNNNKHRIK